MSSWQREKKRKEKEIVFTLNGYIDFLRKKDLSYDANFSRISSSNS